MRGLVVACLLAGVGGCDRRGDWTLFAYPSGLSGGALITPGFRSADMCLMAGREAVTAYAAIRSPSLDAEGASAPLFECGSNCSVYGREALISTCSETLD